MGVDSKESAAIFFAGNSVWKWLGRGYRGFSWVTTNTPVILICRPVTAARSAIYLLLGERSQINRGEISSSREYGSNDELDLVANHATLTEIVDCSMDLDAVRLSLVFFRRKTALHACKTVSVVLSHKGVMYMSTRIFLHN